MPASQPEPDESDGVSPEEAFALLGNDTRVGILQALWDAFESGKGGNAVSYSRLFEQVPIRDSGNFSYHLEKLTGPFVRKTDGGYELKQTGINVVRAVVAGTVIDDPTLGPTAIDSECPLCDASVEVAYADELVTATCTACDGAFRWNGEPGVLYLGLVPPAVLERRSIEEAFRAAVAHSLYEIAALHNGGCPHCAGTVETTVDVCNDHDDGWGVLCPNCDRGPLAVAWLVCTRCKRSVFPPVQGLLLDHPAVTAFYHDHGVEHRFASWEGLVRVFDVEDELLSADPLELRYTIPAEDEELQATLDAELNVVNVATRGRPI